MEVRRPDAKLEYVGSWCPTAVPRASSRPGLQPWWSPDNCAQGVQHVGSIMPIQIVAAQVNPDLGLRWGPLA